MAPVAARLGELLGKPVKATSDCIGDEVKAAAASLGAGEILLLENLRFHPEEAAGDEEFAKQLACLGDVYVNDAFGTAHRAHSSMVGVDLPRACGYLLKKEIDFLGDSLDTPKKPFVAIIGGAKISGKIDVIEALLPKVDKLIIGGAHLSRGLARAAMDLFPLAVRDTSCRRRDRPRARHGSAG